MQALQYPIRVPSDMLEALGEFTGNFWSDTLALEPFICEAIRNYMQARPAEEAHPAAPSEAGYQWKQVYLPDGTRLRASFKGQNYFAEVKGDKIIYGDHAVSPSQFANLRGSGNRNAWKAVWLRLPGSETWLLADVCRSAQKNAIARLLGDEIPAKRPLPGQTQPRSARPAANRPAAITAAPCNEAQPRSNRERSERRKHKAKKQHRAKRR